MTAEVIVRHYNDVALKIEAAPHIIFELNDYFSFKAKNFWFDPRYKNKVWDGKIRLCCLADQTLPVGLYPDLLKWLKKSDYTFEVANNYHPIQFNTSLTDEKIKAFLKALNISLNGKSTDFYDYQEDALIKSLKTNRCILLAATSAGKTLITYGISRYFTLNPKNKLLIVVPSTSLVTQLRKDFIEYSYLNQWDVDKNLHCIYDGATKYSDKPLVCSTWQALQFQKKPYFAQYNRLVVDEVHEAEAKSIKGIVNKLENCPTKIGMTGTLKDSKVHEKALTGMFGPVYNIVTSKELQDSGRAAKATINILVIEYPKEDCELLYPLRPDPKKPEVKKRIRDYQEEIDFLIKSEKRNNVILQLVNRLKGNTLVMFERVEEQGLVLHELFKNKANKPAYIIHGGIKTDERDVIKETIEQATASVLSASYGTFSRGQSVKRLHDAILGLAGESIVKTLQTLGRMLRLGYDKDSCQIWDIVDDLTYVGSRGGKNENYKLSHGLKRIEHYTEQGFEIKYHKVKI